MDSSSSNTPCRLDAKSELFYPYSSTSIYMFFETCFSFLITVCYEIVGQKQPQPQDKNAELVTS